MPIKDDFRDSKIDVRFRSVNGEFTSANKAAGRVFFAQITKITDKNWYVSQQAFNIDETASFLEYWKNFCNTECKRCYWL